MSAEILVIDDEAEIRETVHALLTGQGYSVQTAASGEEALKMIQGSDLALILCDISMPGMSGLELLEKLKVLGLPCALVMLTGHFEKDQIIHALQLGVVDYITKPFNINDFMNSIPNWIHIGKMLRSVQDAVETDSAERIKARIRMIEAFRIKNHKARRVS